MRITVGNLLRRGTQALHFALLRLALRLRLALLGDAFPRHAVQPLVAAARGALDEGEKLHIPHAIDHRGANAGARILQERSYALFWIDDAGGSRGGASFVLGFAEFDSGHRFVRNDIRWQIARQGEQAPGGVGLHGGVVEAGGNGGRVGESRQRHQAHLLRLIFPEHSAEKVLIVVQGLHCGKAHGCIGVIQPRLAREQVCDPFQHRGALLVGSSVASRPADRRVLVRSFPFDARLAWPVLPDARSRRIRHRTTPLRSMRERWAYKPLCVPSQRGTLPVCLQPQKKSVPSFSAS